MNSQFSAVLLAGGHSTRMGADKRFIEIDGVPLWQRQLQVLRRLTPGELFLSAPAHEAWRNEDCVVIPDAQSDAGPLAGLVAALRLCSAPLLVALAVDLPNITTDYLRELVAACTATTGSVPRRQEHFEPVAAVYPSTTLAIAETCLASGRYSLQNFATQCFAAGLVRVMQISPEDGALFLNVNTPQDLLALTDA